MSIKLCVAFAMIIGLAAALPLTDTTEGNSPTSSNLGGGEPVTAKPTKHPEGGHNPTGEDDNTSESVSDEDSDSDESDDSKEGNATIERHSHYSDSDSSDYSDSYEDYRH